MANERLNETLSLRMSSAQRKAIEEQLARTIDWPALKGQMLSAFIRHATELLLMGHIMLAEYADLKLKRSAIPNVGGIVSALALSGQLVNPGEGGMRYHAVGAYWIWAWTAKDRTLFGAVRAKVPITIVSDAEFAKACGCTVEALRDNMDLTDEVLSTLTHYLWIWVGGESAQ
jgi:hypothetical protein